MSATSIAVSDIKFGNVIKANNLIEAKYDLSLIEQKFILMAISLIQNGRNIVRIRIKDFCKLIGTSEERYSEIRNIVRGLRQKEILITKYDNKNDIEEELVAGWINTSFYKNGEIEVEFPLRLMPYLVELKERYTMYNLRNVAHLDSKHAIRVYELLKEHEFKKSVTFNYEKFKEMVCCSDKFDRYYDFKKRVLTYSQEELIKKTDICFELNEVRNGKTIVELNFQIHKNMKVMEERSRAAALKNRMEYYGDSNVENVVHKYRQKDIDELSNELRYLIGTHFGATFELEELYKYSKNTLISVIFGLIDGEYVDVKAPIPYFKKVLKQQEGSLDDE